MNKVLVEIDKLLLSLKNEKIPRSEKSFLRIGLRVPEVRRALSDSSFLDNLSNFEILKSLDYTWKNTKYYESMSFCLYYYQSKELTKTEFNKLKSWVDRCTCWEHSDDLSKIFANVVEQNPNWVLPVFQRWNKSKCSWKRRQSIVGLIEYESKRGRVLPFKDLIQFVTPLLIDNEYYVQKGVGWTLREIFNAYPEQTLRYIEKNLLDLTPIAYSSATEKIDKTVKEKFNTKRKLNRKAK